MRNLYAAIPREIDVDEGHVPLYLKCAASCVTTLAYSTIRPSPVVWKMRP